MFQTSMPHRLQPFFQKELVLYRRHFQGRDYVQAWRHLERAHILGQKYPLEHSKVHWLMLRFGLKVKDGREIVGQLPRLLLGGVKSFVGKIPEGNTGGADVPPLKSMPIEGDLKEILEGTATEVPIN